MINKKISFLIIFLLALVFSFGLLNKSLAQIISCGNGTCESGEDYINCPYDCSGQPAQATGSSTTSSSGGSTSTSSGCICTHQFSFSDGKYCITATTNTGDNLRCIPDTYSYDHRINECVQMGPGCTFTPTNTRCCAQDYKMEFAPTNDTIQYCVSKRLFSGLISDDKNYIQAQFLENFNGGNQCVWVTSQNSCTPPNNSCSNSSPTTPSSSSGSGSPTPSYTCGWGGAYGNYCDPNGTCPPGQKCAEHSSNQCGCITPNVCGNGVLEWGYSINGVVQSESCDDGAQNGLNDKCTKNCKYVCGARNNQNVCADDECPNPGETCAYDSSTNTCSCLPPCGGGTTTNPQCTGRSCPSGEVCTTIITANVNNNTTVGRCECKEPCGSIDPLKFSCSDGACTAPNTTCQSDPTSGQCECLPTLAPPKCEGNLPTNTIIQNINKCNIGNGTIPYNLFGGNDKTCFKCSQFAEVFCKCIKCHWGNVGEVFQLFTECSYTQDCSKTFAPHLINLIKETQGSQDHYYIIEPQLVGLSGINPLTGQPFNPIYCDWTQPAGSAINVPDNCKNARCKAEVNFLSSLQIAPPQPYLGNVYECRKYEPMPTGTLLSQCTNFNVQVGLSDVPAACCPGHCETIPSTTNIPADALNIDEPPGGYNPNQVCSVAMPPPPPPQTPSSCQLKNPDGTITNVPANSSICLNSGTLNIVANCTQDYNLFGTWNAQWLYSACPNYCIQSTDPATGLQKAYCR